MSEKDQSRSEHNKHGTELNNHGSEEHDYGHGEFHEVKALNPHTGDDNTPKHSDYRLYYREGRSA